MKIFSFKKLGIYTIIISTKQNVHFLPHAHTTKSESLRWKARKVMKAMYRCHKRAPEGSSFYGFAGTRLPAAELEPNANGIADTP